MVALRHPHFPKVTQEVEPECVPGWVASGWLDDRPAECCGAEVECDACPAPKPEVKILPAPKPGPKRRAKNSSIGDD